MAVRVAAFGGTGSGGVPSEQALTRTRIFDGICKDNSRVVLGQFRAFFGAIPRFLRDKRELPLHEPSHSWLGFIVNPDDLTPFTAFSIDE